MERQFRLESVLSYRQQLEDEAREALARAQEELRAAEEHQRVLVAAREQLWDELARREVAPSVDVGIVAGGFAHRDFLDARIAEQTEQVQKLENKVERQREELVVAMKNRKALENLKDRHLAAYLAWVSQAEGRLLDDVALAQYWRNRDE